MNRRLKQKHVRKLLAGLATAILLVQYQCSRPSITEPSQKASTSIYGKVVKISDGDTLTVLDENKKPHRVRILGLDAPERSQPFGKRSTESLKELIGNREIAVQTQERDRYGRILGKIVLDGLDLGLEQIKRGMAWHYKFFEFSQPPEDRHVYSTAESHAREKRLGLWAEPNPIPPWDYRKKKKSP